MRIHSADIARRAGKQATWIDDRLRWIKQNKPELWAELDAQEAARKGHKEINTNDCQTAWTLSAARTAGRYHAVVDDLIEVLAAKIDANPIEWRNYAADLLGCDHGADHSSKLSNYSAIYGTRYEHQIPAETQRVAYLCGPRQRVESHTH